MASRATAATVAITIRCIVGTFVITNPPEVEVRCAIREPEPECSLILPLPDEKCVFLFKSAGSGLARPPAAAQHLEPRLETGHDGQPFPCRADERFLQGARRFIHAPTQPRHDRVHPFGLCGGEDGRALRFLGD